MPAPTKIREFTAFTSNLVNGANTVFTLANDVTGNSILVIAMINGSATTLTCTDSVGNTYTSDTATTCSFGNAHKLFAFTAPMGTPLRAGDTVTLTPNNTASISVVMAFEYSGLHGNVDKALGASGTSTAPASGNTATTTVPEESAFGIVAWNNGVAFGDLSSPSAGYTLLDQQSNGTYFLQVYEKDLAATGAQSFSATFSGSRAWSCNALTYRGTTLRYIDLVSGSNANTGLSWAQAKLTFAGTTPLAGDIVKVAKTADPTSLTGTLTWTNNSTSVATSVDLTASLAAGDTIAPASNGSQGWFEVSSITASTITLVNKFFGSNQTTASFKLPFFSEGAVATASTVLHQLVSASGSTASPIQVIGGWNTGSDIRNGYTVFGNTGASRNGYAIQSNGNSTQYSYFGALRTNRGFYAVNTQVAVSNYFTSGTGERGIFVQTNTPVVDNCIVSHATNNGIDLNVANAVFTNNAVIGGAAVHYVLGTYNYMFNCTSIGLAASVNSIQPGGPYNYIYNCTISNPASSSGNAGISYSTFAINNVVLNVTSTGLSTDVKTANSVGGDNYHTNCLLSSATPVTVPTTNSTNGRMHFDRWQQTAGASRTYTELGLILTNTVNARGGSGQCMEIQPSMGQALQAFKGNSFNEIVFPFPVDSGSTRSVTAWLSKSSTWNGFYCKIGLRQKGQWIGSDPVNFLPTTSYTQFSDSVTATENEVVELVVMVDGSAGSIYVDDVAWA